MAEHYRSIAEHWLALWLVSSMAEHWLTHVGNEDGILLKRQVSVNLMHM